ncbi:MAG: outer membrane protein transport protein [Candidatus Omnitrophota bacterium]
MISKGKAIILVIALAFAMCLVLNDFAYAGNGTRFLGFSARDSGMGGATTASPADTSCLVRNPASLVWIGNRIDLEYLNILPHDVTMHTEGVLANAGTRQKSNITYLPGADAGISYRIPGTDKYPVSVGCGIFTMAGLALNYPAARFNPILLRDTHDFDKMVDLRSLRIAPGIAVAFNDKLSFGGTANIGIQGLRTNLTTTATYASQYLETAGNGDWDFAPGAGFTLGLLYKFNEMLNLGASYESHGWFGHHYKYKDCLPYIDEPPVINAGVSLKPIRDFEWTFDTRYINWTDVKLARNGPESGGFGWGDQWVFATGGEYSFKDKKNDDKFKLRLGYMYGKSPVQAHVVFANALLPVIMEHHLTMGFSYFVMKNLSLDFVWEHHFMGVKADNGCGDTYSVNGNGTKVTAAAEILGVGLGYQF